MEKRNDRSSKEKSLEIVVNAQAKTVSEKELTFDQVVRLAFDNPCSDASNIYTVTYDRGNGNKPKPLAPGDDVRVKKGMIFSVTPTCRS